MESMEWNEEYDLIIAAQQGNEEALTEIYERYKGMIISIMCQYRFKGTCMTDVLAAAKEGFFVALQKHDPTKGYLGPYAKQWCRHYCKCSLKNQAIYVPNAKYKEVKTTKVMFEDNEHGKAYSEKFDEMDKETLRKFIAELPDDERQVLTLRMDGMMLKDIEKHTRFNSSQAASKCYDRAIRMLKAKFKKDLNLFR